MPRREQPAFVGAREPDSIYQNARAAAERAFRASGGSMLLGAHSHQGRQYQRLERGSKSDGQGSHLARSKSLRGPKKKPADTRAQQRLRMQISLPKLFQSSYTGNTQPLPTPLVGPQNRNDSCILSCNRDDANPRYPVVPVEQPRKWELANPGSQTSCPQQHPAESSCTDFGLLRDDDADSPPGYCALSNETEAANHGDSMQQLRALMSLSFPPAPPEKPKAKLRKMIGSSTHQKERSKPKESAPDSADSKPRTLRRTLNKISNPLRGLYSRRSSRNASAQSQLPAQHVQARRSHVFSEDTVRRMAEAGSTSRLISPEPTLRSSASDAPILTRRIRASFSRASFRLPSTGEHRLHDLDGTSHGASRLTSWAESSLPNATMRCPSLHAVEECQGSDGSSTPTVQASRFSSAGTTRRLKIPRRKSSISFNKKTTGVDSQRMYSALMRRIGGSQESQDLRDSHLLYDAQTSHRSAASSSHQTALTSTVGSKYRGKPTIRVVESSGSEEEPDLENVALVSDRIRIPYNGGRANMTSPSIYSGGGFESKEQLQAVHSLEHQNMRTGTALVSDSRPVAVWSLGVKQLGQANSLLNTSGDWRAWTSSTMANVDSPVSDENVRLCSFGNLGTSRVERGDSRRLPSIPPRVGRSASHHDAGDEVLRSTHSATRVMNDSAQDPFGNGFNSAEKENKAHSPIEAAQPRFPSRIGGGNATQTMRRRPVTFQPGSPINDKFLKNIRKGPWGIASPDASPEKHKRATMTVSPPKFPCRDENTPPTGGQRMADEFLQGRKEKRGGGSPAFL